MAWFERRISAPIIAIIVSIEIDAQWRWSKMIRRGRGSVKTAVIANGGEAAIMESCIFRGMVLWFWVLILSTFTSGWYGVAFSDMLWNNKNINTEENSFFDKVSSIPLSNLVLIVSAADWRYNFIHNYYLSGGQISLRWLLFGIKTDPIKIIFYHYSINQ